MIQMANPLFLPDANWCWAPGRKAQEAGYTLFRRNFTCQTACCLELAVSADNRYNLFLDGKLLGRGPCRGDLQHYSYETCHMEVPAGNHVLAAEVVVYCGGWRHCAAPWGEIHAGGGFICAGSCGKERLDTPSHWLCSKDFGRNPLEWIDSWNAKILTPVPPLDQIDFYLHRFDWASLDFDDSFWKEAILIGQACLEGQTFMDQPTPWLLTPSRIRQLQSEATPIAAILQSENAKLQLEQGRIRGMIPAGKHRILIDIGRNQTSMIHFSGLNAPGKCRIAYAETLPDNDRMTDWSAPGLDTEPIGYSDLLILTPELWQYDSFWYRSGRYIELSFDLKEELTLLEFSLAFFAYDFSLLADFSAKRHPHLDKIWSVAWHTARCCAHEHYEDCPYYEQLQYAGDSRVQALISYAAAADDTLGRQALRHFDWSRGSNGLTQSRYPGNFSQIIPEFSLIWILMIQDHFQYFADPSVISEHLDGICRVLDCFEAHRLQNGLVGRVNGWNFTDWAEEWPQGKSDRGTGEPETILNLFHAEACRAAAQLCLAVKRPLEASQFQQRRRQTLQSVNALCFCPERGLFRDVPSRNWFSCHANALAIISSAAPDDLLQSIGEQLCRNPALTQGTLYFNFYILEALKKCRLADGFLQKFTLWQQMLERGSTTFPECPTANTRSQCHAWSAAPVYEFITGLMGVSPCLPGFRKVRIAPLACGSLDLKGQVPIAGKSILKLEIEGDILKLNADKPLDLCLVHPTGGEEELRLSGGKTEIFRLEQTNRTLKSALQLVVS